MGRSGKKKSNNHNGVNANILRECVRESKRVVAKETVNLGNIKSNKTAVNSPFKPHSHICVYEAEEDISRVCIICRIQSSHHRYSVNIVLCMRAERRCRCWLGERKREKYNFKFNCQWSCT